MCLFLLYQSKDFQLGFVLDLSWLLSVVSSPLLDHKTHDTCGCAICIFTKMATNDLARVLFSNGSTASNSGQW